MYSAKRSFPGTFLAPNSMRSRYQKKGNTYYGNPLPPKIWQWYIKNFQNICKSNPKKYFPMEFEFEILREPQKKYFRYFKIIGTRNATDNTVLPANLLIFSIILLSNNIMKYTHSVVYIAVKWCKLLKYLIRLVSALI